MDDLDPVSTLHRIRAATTTDDKTDGDLHAVYVLNEVLRARATHERRRREQHADGVGGQRPVQPAEQE